VLNDVSTLNCAQNNNDTYFNYPIVANSTYIIKNTSASGDVAIWSVSGSGGSTVETISAGLGKNGQVRFTAAQDAPYIRVFHNVNSGAGSITIYNADTLEQRIVDLETPELTADIVCWGDSLTYGAGGNTFGGYVTVLKNELGVTAKNCGVSGETANTIACRQGGSNIVIPAGPINGVYPTLTDVFGASVSPLLNPDVGGSTSKFYIEDEVCTLAHSNDGYTISGYTGGTSAKPLLAKFSGFDFTSKIVILFVGQNGVYVDGLTGIDPYITVIKSMIAHIGHNRYIICGLSSGTQSDKAAIDTRYLQEFGNKYFPTRRMLVDYGLAINGLTPTTQDEADIAVGTVPAQLRADAVHLNDYGYNALGKMLADKIRGLGYNY
jgi:lysophospholipase L1-like esterase